MLPFASDAHQDLLMYCIASSCPPKANFFAALREVEDMPSYEEALTAFAEARSLLARAEDAMQNAVQVQAGCNSTR